MQDLPPGGQCAPTGGVQLSWKLGSWLASTVVVAGTSPTSDAGGRGDVGCQHLDQAEGQGALVGCQELTDGVPGGFQVLVLAVKQLFPEFEFMWLVDEAKKNLPLELDFLNEGRNAEKVAQMLKHFDFLKVLVLAVKQLFPEFEFMWLVDEAKKNLPLELDFLNEGRNAEKVAQMLKHFDFLKVPQIYWELSTKRVLLMEFLDGGQVNDRDYMERNKIDVNEISGQQTAAHEPHAALWPLECGSSTKYHVRARMYSAIETLWPMRRSRGSAAQPEAGLMAGECSGGGKELGVLDCERDAGEYRRAISRHLGKIYSEMIFVNGFVHCDPHPGNVLVRKGPDTGKVEIVLLDHGLYQVLTEEFRLDYCHLWQSLIWTDMEKVKKYCHRLGAGDFYPLLACMLTARSWNSVNRGISQAPITASEFISSSDPDNSPMVSGLRPIHFHFCPYHRDLLNTEIRNNAATYLPQISQLLNRVPRQMLLIFKTNDLLRGIEATLGTRASASSFLNMSRCCVRALATNNKKNTCSFFRRTQISFSETISLWQISLHELILRVKGLRLASWVLALLCWLLPAPH
ncbi:Putative aarF domain-containing protein kinase 1 [Myotis brandtii]|uniref:AarF domain-containing protein kinase 1 n=1 Tax=Myotis brandtii TaxID=109478 RepID=S7P883_MYOBR|nr:Putative aarF domain-containing protein kinase 1 [Myotis brandtii]